MNISILSVFPELYKPFLNTSLIARAQEQGHTKIEVDGLFSFVKPKERIDSPAFGPGAGMVLRPDVIERAVRDKEKQYGPAYKIFFSPQGKKLNQRYLQRIADKARELKHVMLLPARYEGMDTRVEEYYADEIISIGDFVLMGGDLPAMIFLEGLLRLIPGVVGKAESVAKESFSGPFVDFPAYTEPVIWHDIPVPEIIRSGNHAAIEEWRKQRAIHNTVMYHFDWLRTYRLTAQQKKACKDSIPPHYVVLNHADVMIGPEKTVGTSSVTSIDLHDIARSAYTYGIENFFVVTPLVDQQKVVKTLLDFWHTGPGFSYNRSRFEALAIVQLKESIDQVISFVQEKHKQKPLLIATSARTVEGVPFLSFYDQAKIWSAGRPVIIILGTAKGLSDEFIKRCDYIFVPLDGFSDFNHLSVRSAAAIIFDRWMGINVAIE